MMHTKYDDEILEVEARLSRERDALARGVQEFTHTAKCNAASPKGLVIATAVGFLFGELTRPRRRRAEQGQSSIAPRAVGMGGLLGGVALALIRAQFGSPLGMGKAAIEYAAARRRARAAARSPASPEPPVGSIDSSSAMASYPRQSVR